MEAMQHVVTLAIRGRGEHRELETRTDGTSNALLLPNGGRDGIGCGAVAFQAVDYASGTFAEVDQASPITTSADRTRAAPIQVSGIPALAGCLTTGEGYRLNPEITTMLPVTAGTLDRGIPGRGAGNFAGYADHLLPGPMQVRRLTPTECARLQGFPDHHARIPWRGKPAEDCPDGPQYKAYGNSMCANVMRWIGRRLDQQLKGEK